MNTGRRRLFAIVLVTVGACLTLTGCVGNGGGHGGGPPIERRGS